MAIKIDKTTLRLPNNQYVDEPQAKTLLVLHHTVGSQAKSTVDYWRSDAARIGTAYIIERTGEIFETFPADRWAYHLGLKAPVSAGGIHEKRSIGIELASEGGLEKLGSRYFAFGGKREVHPSSVVDIGASWRGFRYFDKYDPPQVESCIALVQDILTRFPSIPRQTKKPRTIEMLKAELPGGNPGDAATFRGVIAHCDIRTDKTDVGPHFPWDRLIAECGLRVV